MTLRERIADWISGGAFSRAVHDKLYWSHLASRRRDDKIYWVEMASYRREALNEIAAMETPGANGTVKRMAKRAREALK